MTTRPGSGPVQLVKWTQTFEAGIDLSDHQWRGVYVHTNGKILAPLEAAADNDRFCIGILQNKPSLGQDGDVMLQGMGRIEAGEAIAVGALFRIGPKGKAYTWEKTDADSYCVGQCVGSAATADEDIIQAVFNFIGPFSKHS